MQSSDYMRIKVCGMREKKNIEELVKLPVDYIGFIFYEKSPRYVGTQVDPSAIAIIPPHIQKVGVFVNMKMDDVIRIAEFNQIDFLQLHGEETPEYCSELQDKGYSIIKAFKADYNLQEKLESYRFSVNYYLFDTPTKNYGGSGNKFNWKTIESLKIHVPFFLSGGISHEDAKTLKNMKIPNLHAIDINSKFEINPGLKNIETIKNFVNELRS